MLSQKQREKGNHKKKRKIIKRKESGRNGSKFLLFFLAYPLMGRGMGGWLVGAGRGG